MNNLNYIEALKLEILGSSIQIKIFNFAQNNRRYLLLNALADRKDLSAGTLVLFSKLNSIKYITRALGNNKTSLKTEMQIVNNITKISDVEELVNQNLLSIDSIVNRCSEIKDSFLLDKFLKYAEASSAKKDKVFKRYIELLLREDSLIEFEKLSDGHYSFETSGYIRNNRYNKDNYYTVENFAKIVASSDKYHSLWKNVMSGISRDAVEIFSKQTMKIVETLVKRGNTSHVRNSLNCIAHEIEIVISKYGFDDLSVALMRNFFKICEGNEYDIRFLYPYYYRVGHGSKKKILNYIDYSYEQTVATCINSILNSDKFDFYDFQNILKLLFTKSNASTHSNDVPLVLSYYVNKHKPNLDVFEKIVLLQSGFFIENKDLAGMFEDEKYVGYYLALSNFNNFGVLELVKNKKYVLDAHKEIYNLSESVNGLYFLDLCSDLFTKEEIVAMDLQYLTTSYSYRDLVEKLAIERDFDEIATEVFQTLERDFCGNLDGLLSLSKGL